MSLSMQGDLEVSCSVDVCMMSSAVLRRKLIRWNTELVGSFYVEPCNDGCVGCFVETPVASINFNFPFFPKDKVKKMILKLKIRKSKRKKRRFHEGH